MEAWVLWVLGVFGAVCAIVGVVITKKTGRKGWATMTVLGALVLAAAVFVASATRLFENHIVF